MLEACKVIEETPSGLGFGDTALKLALVVAIKPMMQNGAAVDGGKVVVPINFKPSK